MGSRRPRVFLDANVFFSGIAFPKGPPGRILELYAAGEIEVVISRQVLEEVARTIQAKAPRALGPFQRLVAAMPPEVEPDPTTEEVARWAQVINPADTPILAAAVRAQPDYLVTGDQHFLDNPAVAEASSLRVVSPGEFINAFRDRDFFKED
ncbi:MAG TPA: putative toxin-antitoxin system toxin component, PIN family [Dehalococcoidia bacterium]|nr:putative toxin-antitoxin system toxin component, PIN family [Dehalococcoidia bacterium]